MKDQEVHREGAPIRFEGECPPALREEKFRRLLDELAYVGSRERLDLDTLGGMLRKALTILEKMR